MLSRWRIPLVLAGLLIAPCASAHSPIEGIGDFYAGILHPAVVPAQLLALFSLGLFLGQRGLTAMRVGYCAFVPAIVAGLFASGAGWVPVMQPWLLAASICCGFFAALQLRTPVALAGLLAAGVGVAVGLDSFPESDSVAQAAAVLAGSGLGACIGLVVFAAIAELAQREWQRIAVRVAGSWSAASSLLVLSLLWVTGS
ncbi:HupE/UreJ family protein [Pseudohalioglobus sediminis]|uniref:HupE/UreJ family protein n=1 Tax=Pseudohalioglobus sediminis TaxID=2606449 RepID=UPI00292F8BCA|nr:HupE/UreJ family protein [Pseudohalioglobus sediminis]